MDSWPRDDRDSRNPASAHGKKGRRSEYVANAYPNLRQGMVGAATLVKKSGRFEWSFLQQVSSPSRNWRLGQSFEAFPHTRPSALSKPSITIKQQAEQGANFLRTYLPDVEVPTELIRDKIQEEVTFANQLQDFDPYLGSLLAVVSKPASDLSVTGYIAFAMGETMRDLNVSTYDTDKQKGTTLKMVARPMASYRMPIQQVVGASSSINSLLAVRTFVDTNVLKLKKPGTARPFDTLATINKQGTHNRLVVDVKLQPTEVVLVDDHGGIHIQDLAVSKLTAQDPPIQDEETDDRFWRLSMDVTAGNGFFVSSKQLWGFDARARTTSLEWTSLNPKDVITSVEDCREDKIVRLCSTSRIVWLDRRNMRKSLLSTPHYREHGRYLRTDTLGTSPTFTILTTRKNGLVSIYDASRGEDRLFHIQGSPRPVLPQSDQSQGSIGEVFLFNPFLPQADEFTLLKLSDRGALTGFSITSNETDVGLSTNVECSEEIKVLESEVKTVADVGPLGGREKSEVDMFPAYDKMFREYNELASGFEESEAHAVYDLLDAVPSFFQRSELPIDHLLTTYDVAFRAGEEPQISSRSDFLTGNVLNSTRGYRALAQGRLNSEPLRNTASWHLKLDKVLKHLDSDMGPELPSLESSLASYALVDDEHRPIRSHRLEKRDKEQLALDLMLSRDVYSTQPLVVPTDVDHALETMTEALTLGDEPPAFEFSFLKPVRKDHYSEDAMDESSSENTGSGMGVRLLLKDWEIGSDPDAYQYRDPYNTTEENLVEPPRNLGAYIPVESLFAPAIITQRPPTLLPANATTRPDTQNLVASQGVSQHTMSLYPMQSQAPTLAESQTQDVTASTQTLPGPFGGRPGAKKKPKKRIGGF